MKIESVVKMVAEHSVLEVYPDGMESAALFAGNRKVLSIGRVQIGNFNENLGLAAKLRRHFANDGLSAGAESGNVIPFGCEYQVKRQWKFSGGIGEVTGDIAADNGGRINDLALEELIFPGEAEKIEFLLCGESEINTVPVQETIYEGEILPVRVKVTYSDGISVEFFCGDDLWRHNCASAFPGGRAFHRITAQSDGIHWERRVLQVPEEVEVEKRPWRFKALFAVSRNAAEPVVPGVVMERSGCFAAPAVRRDFRSFIRKAGAENCRLKFSGKLFCTDGSHINRPGKQVLHSFLGELFDEYIWAGTVMARKDGTFTIECAVPELAGSVIAGNLSLPPDMVADGMAAEEF